MKKTSKLIVVVSILMMIVVVGVMVFVFKDDSNPSNNNNNNLSSLDKLLFSTNQVKDMVSSYSINDKEIEIASSYLSGDNKDEILLSDMLSILEVEPNSNNEISVEGFVAGLDNGYVFQKSGKDYVNVKFLVNDLGYKVDKKESGLLLTREFGTKRLIVPKACNKTFGAVDAVSNGQYKYLQYDSELKTSQAFESIAGSGEDILIDSIVKMGYLETNDESKLISESVAGVGDSWGYDYMNFAAYNKRITEKYDTLDEVVVAVVDTGINENHVYFKDRIVDGGKAFCIGYGLDEYADDNGHGTHVAGIITQCTTPNVKILPVKVSGESGKLLITNVILSLEYVALLSTEMNIRVVNLSLGARSESIVAKGIFAPVLKQLEGLNIACVAGAGNDGADVKYTVPASINSIITVGSLDSNSDLSYFSNYGEEIDVVAPGRSIESAFYKNNEKTVSLSGTSMAAPHASAAVAMLYCDKDKNYNLNTIKMLLHGNINDDLGEEGFDEKFGYGSINMAKAMLNDLSTNELKEYDIKFKYISNSGIIYPQHLPFCNIEYLGLNGKYFSERLDDTREQIIKIFTTNPQIILTSQDNEQYSVAGWKLSESPYYPGSLINNNIISLYENKTTYLSLVIEPLDYLVEFNFNFQDVKEFDGFASYETKLDLTITSLINGVQTEAKYSHVCSYRANTQVFEKHIKSTDIIEFKITADTDSKIDSLYYDHLKRPIKSEVYESKLYCINFVESELKDRIITITVNVLI